MMLGNRFIASIGLGGKGENLVQRRRDWPLFVWGFLTVQQMGHESGGNTAIG
jgi:hypothetical protein